MTKRAYWAVFLKNNAPPGLQYLLKFPDEEGARLRNKEEDSRPND